MGENNEEYFDDGILSFWTAKERLKFAEHMMKELKKIEELSSYSFAVFIEPEIEFLKDSWRKNLKASIHGGWRICIRETLVGVPFEYNQYMRSVIHEMAHVVADKVDPDHTHDSGEFKATINHFKKTAKKLGIWPKKEVPDELVELFDQTTNCGEKISYLLQKIAEADLNYIKDLTEGV